MKNVFPVNPVVEVLNTKINKETNEVSTILFTPLTEEQVDNFTLLIKYFNTFPKNHNKRKDLAIELLTTHHLDFANILAIGDTSISPKLVNGYIESLPIKINEIPKNNYKCFVNKDWKTIGQMNLPYHEDGGCSWNCLMTKTKHPAFGIIYSVPNELLNKFIKDGNRNN